MTAVPSTSFGQKFAQKFRDSSESAVDRDLVVFEIIQSIGRHIRMPLHLRQDRDSISSAIFEFIKTNVSPNLKEHQNPLAYLRTAINREWWRQIRIECARPKSLTSNDGREDQKIRKPEPIDPMRRARGYRQKKLPPASTGEIKAVIENIRSRIRITAKQSALAESPEQHQILDGIMIGLQESHRYITGEFLPADSSLSKFTKTARLPKDPT